MAAEGFESLIRSFSVKSVVVLIRIASWPHTVVMRLRPVAFNRLIVASSSILASTILVYIARSFAFGTSGFSPDSPTFLAVIVLPFSSQYTERVPYRNPLAFDHRDKLCLCRIDCLGVQSKLCESFLSHLWLYLSFAYQL